VGKHERFADDGRRNFHVLPSPLSASPMTQIVISVFINGLA
jgi:hypothetical protein